jgi:hypothetical protein
MQPCTSTSSNLLVLHKPIFKKWWYDPPKIVNNLTVVWSNVFGETLAGVSSLLLYNKNQKWFYNPVVVSLPLERTIAHAVCSMILQRFGTKPHWRSRSQLRQPEETLGLFAPVIGMGEFTWSLGGLDGNGGNLLFFFSVYRKRLHRPTTANLTWCDDIISRWNTQL